MEDGQHKERENAKNIGLALRMCNNSMNIAGFGRASIMGG